METERNSRLIDFWIDSEEKKKEPKPTPVFNLIWDSFFGWIMYLMLPIVLMIPLSGCWIFAVDGAMGQNIEMPDSWTAPRPIQVWNTGCCCDSNTIMLNRIYNNQEYIKIQNRPSTIQEIHNSTFKSSSSLNNLLKGGNH